jgi:hypothetical protein
MNKSYITVCLGLVLLAAGCDTSNNSMHPLPPIAEKWPNAVPPTGPAPIPPPAPTIKNNGGAKSAIVIQVPSDLSGMVGQEFSRVFEASGGAEPYTWRVTAGALPPGLEFGPVLVIPDCSPVAPPAETNCRVPYNDPSAIKITGTPIRSGSFAIVLSATDSLKYSGTASVTFVVK